MFFFWCFVFHCLFLRWGIPSGICDFSIPPFLWRFVCTVYTVQEAPVFLCLVTWLQICLWMLKACHGWLVVVLPGSSSHGGRIEVSCRLILPECRCRVSRWWMVYLVKLFGWSGWYQTCWEMGVLCFNILFNCLACWLHMECYYLFQLFVLVVLLC